MTKIGYAVEMEMTSNDKPESLTSEMYEIAGEPALVINGVPPVCTTGDGTTERELDSKHKVCFGEWLEGREVGKLFGGVLYNGKVREFDKETGWYRVVYEDGDFEDLEWHELEEVLLPLDITIPLKTLTSKVIKKMQKHEKRSGKSVPKELGSQLKKRER